MAKAKRKALKLPVIGDVVAVTWLDSGMIRFRTETPFKDCDLAYERDFGLCTYIDEEKCVVTHSFPVSLDGSRIPDTTHTSSTMATPSISAVVIYGRCEDMG